MYQLISQNWPDNFSPPPEDATYRPTSCRRMTRSCFPRRYTKLWLTALTFLIVSAVLWMYDTVILAYFPPLYGEYYEFENSLPQHDASLPFPEGAKGRYFFPENHVWGLGWNNALQELIFLSHLAYRSNRSFVFEPYAWNKDPLKPYSQYYGHLIPSRIPLNALISGPTAGGSFGLDPPVPRSVNKKYWEKVCPQPTVISTSEFSDSLDALPDADAALRMEKWVEKLNSIDDRCVQIDPFSKQVFEFYVFGNKNILSLWPELSQSPIITRFTWSPLVLSALNTNADLLLPASPSSAPSSTLPLLQGVLALHIRRGDYATHCAGLAKWSATFMGFSQFPALPDQFTPPPGGGWGENTPENTAEYMAHCWPSIAQIAAKVAAVRTTPAARGLRRVLVMTNGDAQWVAALKRALEDAGVWDAVTSSLDLRLSREQKFISQAIDMAVAQHAQVFIGNGFSSLTSNVVMLRMANGMPPESSRFW